MRRCTVALLLLLLILSSSTAYATGQLGKRITVYSWLPSFKGEMCFFDTTANIDASFGDISDYMNFPIALNTEYWPARWGFYFNFNYIGLEEESISDDLTQITIVKTVDMVFMDFARTNVPSRLSRNGPALLTTASRAWAVSALLPFRHLFMSCSPFLR